MIETLDKLERPSACGLAALILIAQREQTSVAYQHKEWNFSDIPRDIIDYVDQFDDTFQLAIAKRCCEAQIAQRITDRLNKVPDDAQVTGTFTGLLPLKNS